jgi:hypothetical protein
MTSIAAQASANPTATQPAAPLGQLQPGDVLSAIVAKVINATTLQLLSALGSFDIQTEVPLAAGTRVELAVAGTPTAPTFTLQQPSADPAAQKFAAAVTVVAVKANAAPVPNSPANASSAAPVPTPPSTSTTPLPAAEPAVQAAAAIVRNAATRQGGLAQLYADLGALVTQSNAAIPRPVAAAISQLFGLRLQPSPDGAIDAGDIRTVLARSGLAEGTATPTKGQPFSKPADLASLLTTLRQALKTWADAEANAPVAAKLLQTAPAALQTPTKSATPMPPFRDGPTIAQALASPSLPISAGPREQALYLLDKTDAAVARQTLMQIASLPDRPEPGLARGGDATRLTFDIPLATALGTAVAQVRIERDGSNAHDSETGPVWRASFSVDVEPIGPVHVRIAQVNGKTTVGLTAERAESAASLKADLTSLENGLRGAELEPGSISCRSGTPAVPSATPGMFVDQPT